MGHLWPRPSGRYQLDMIRCTSSASQLEPDMPFTLEHLEQRPSLAPVALALLIRLTGAAVTQIPGPMTRLTRQRRVDRKLVPPSAKFAEK